MEADASGATRIEFRGAKAPRDGRYHPIPHRDIDPLETGLAGVSVSKRRLETGWLVRIYWFLRLDVLLY